MKLLPHVSNAVFFIMLYLAWSIYYISAGVISCLFKKSSRFEKNIIHFGKHVQ